MVQIGIALERSFLITHHKMLIYFIISISLSSISKSLMDTLRFHFSTSIFKNCSSWWNPSESWKNKWKNGDPNQGEKFLGSSTIFVSFTDGWHLFQHFFLFFMFLSFILYSCSFPIITWTWWMISDFILIYAYFTILFQIIYWSLNKK